MSLPSQVAELIERFEAQKSHFRSGLYNETQTRIDFVNPFFAALGWDLDNQAGLTENLREVVHEDRVKVGLTMKAPDYSFRVGGQRKFFVETKKPGVNLKLLSDPAYQLRRYAWTAKLPVSILTDFEEFAVYDGRVPPVYKDLPSRARLDYFTYKDYSERWDEIAARFSRDAVAAGSLDRFAETGRKGVPVDAKFLEAISGWREKLARHLAEHNPSLSPRSLNVAVQMILDRIIFLRICEDRGVETEYRLSPLLNGANTYARLLEIFHHADARYNSGLFHFKKEAGRDGEDTITDTLTLADRPLKEIIAGLYYPESPFEFSVFPADILGQVYEQFLGKVIRIEGRSAVVEEKPEVKKAGGVYYTPTYIVNYIVAHTVGKLLENRTPKTATSLSILDPACGSGSFLIGAYQFLLDWHLRWYVSNDPAQWTKGKTPAVFQSGADESGRPQWRLTTAEKKRILLNNIYGVDIDTQAVEVTKLSLLLKVLEGESAETINSSLKLFKGRALPDLEANIKCGNSLIGLDFYDANPNLSSDDQLRVNAFDWNAAFPKIMPAGFDVVIGNPPYGFHQIHNELAKQYFKSHFSTISGSFENYFLFYEVSLRLLKQGGVHSFIVPVTWLTIPSASELRKFVLNHFALRSISWLPEFVFKNAKVNTLVSVIENSKSDKTEVLISKSNNPGLNEGVVRTFRQDDFIEAGSSINIFEDKEETDLLSKLIPLPVLSSFARPCSGYNPYEIGKGKDLAGNSHTQETIDNRPYHNAVCISEEWKPEAVGKDLRRYELRWPTHRFVKYGSWLSAARDPSNFVGHRLLVQEITGGAERRIIATYCDKELYYSRDIIPIKCEQEKPHPFYLLGAVNSKLITWFHHRRNPKAKKALFPKVLVSDLKSIPICPIDFSSPSDKAKHDKMVSLVERMLTLHKQKADAQTTQEKDVAGRQIAQTDAQIDKLVYALYGLTAEEIVLVEAG